MAHCDQVADRHVRYQAVSFKSPYEEHRLLTAFVRLGPDGPGACEGAAVGGGMQWGAKFPPLTRPKGGQLSPEGFVRGLSQ